MSRYSTLPVFILFCKRQHHRRTEGRCKFLDRVFFARIPALPWTGFSSTDRFLPLRKHTRSQFSPLVAFFQYHEFFSPRAKPQLYFWKHPASTFRNAEHISERNFLYLPFLWVSLSQEHCGMRVQTDAWLTELTDWIL
jgi:hypothetical protein